MADEILTENIAHLSHDLEVQIDSLSDEGQAQVYDAIEAASDAGGAVEVEDVHAAVADAQEADVHREAAVEHQHAQAEAADRGDYAAAHEHAVAAGYEIEAVADLGGEDHTIEQAHEIQHLDQAQWEQDTAHEHAVTAEDYAAHGDLATADTYAGLAAGHAETAAYHGGEGDHGGTYGATDSATDTSSTE